MKSIAKKILALPIRIALVLLLLGSLFSIMKWPFSKELIAIGGISIAILYGFRFAYKNIKDQLDYIKLALIILWVFKNLSKVFHLGYDLIIVELLLTLLFIWWLIEEGFSYFRARRFRGKGVLKISYFIIASLAFFGVSFGLLFNIQHWPYGSDLLALGTLMLCALLIIDYFVIKEDKPEV